MIPRGVVTTGAKVKTSPEHSQCLEIKDAFEGIVVEDDGEIATVATEKRGMVIISKYWLVFDNEKTCACQERGQSDREFLIWIHQRLVRVHGERHLEGHMHKLRELIHETPTNRNSLSNIVNMKSNIVMDEIRRLEALLITPRRAGKGSADYMTTSTQPRP